jgi:hypothetical protein
LSPPVRFKVQYVFLNDRPPSSVAKAFIQTLTETFRQNGHH